MQTPTVLLLDADRTVRTRFGRPPRPAELAAALDTVLTAGSRESDDHHERHRPRDRPALAPLRRRDHDRAPAATIILSPRARHVGPGIVLLAVIVVFFAIGGIAASAATRTRAVPPLRSSGRGSHRRRLRGTRAPDLRSAGRPGHHGPRPRARLVVSPTPHPSAPRSRTGRRVSSTPSSTSASSLPALRVAGPGGRVPPATQRRLTAAGPAGPPQTAWRIGPTARRTSRWQGAPCLQSERPSVP